MELLMLIDLWCPHNPASWKGSPQSLHAPLPAQSLPNLPASYAFLCHSCHLTETVLSKATNDWIFPKQMCFLIFADFPVAFGTLRTWSFWKLSSLWFALTAPPLFYRNLLLKELLGSFFLSWFPKHRFLLFSLYYTQLEGHSKLYVHESQISSQNCLLISKTAALHLEVLLVPQMKYVHKLIHIYL